MRYEKIVCSNTSTVESYLFVVFASHSYIPIDKNKSYLKENVCNIGIEVHVLIKQDSWL